MLILPFERPFLIGVVHLLPTPGSPGHRTRGAALMERACQDAQALARGGCDGLIVENFGDTPFHPDRVPAETIAAMALALQAVRESARGLPVGVNVLRNDARAALGLCAAAGAAFLRVNIHTGAMVTDQGVIEGRAAETLRERERLGLDVPLLADVHVKHAVPLGPQSLGDAARDAAGRGLADGLIVSGAATGSSPDPQDLLTVREAVGAEVPLVIGSGATLDNVDGLMTLADGAIVGTALKRDGRVDEPVDEQRVQAMASAVHGR